MYTYVLKRISAQSKSVANCCILFVFGDFDDTIRCKIRALKYWLQVIHCEQTKLRAICYNYQSRNVDCRCWANEIRNSLEKIGMGWVWEKGRENHRNVWRKVRRRLMDINQQEIMRDCKEMKSLSLRKEIKASWGKEPYLHVLGLQESSGLGRARLGAWRALKFTDDSGVRVCPICCSFEH